MTKSNLRTNSPRRTEFMMVGRHGSRSRKLADHIFIYIMGRRGAQLCSHKGLSQWCTSSSCPVLSKGSIFSLVVPVTGDHWFKYMSTWGYQSEYQTKQNFRVSLDPTNVRCLRIPRVTCRGWLFLTSYELWTSLQLQISLEGTLRLFTYLCFLIWPHE